MLCAIAVVYLTEWLGTDAAESCLVFSLSSVSGLHDFYRQCRDMTGELQFLRLNGVFQCS